MAIAFAKTRLLCLMCVMASGDDTQDKVASPVFLQSNGAQDLQVQSSFAKDLIQKAEEVVGVSNGNDDKAGSVRAFEYIGSACATEAGDAQVASLGFVQSLKVEKSPDFCKELAKAAKYMSGADQNFQPDEMDDAVAFLVFAAGGDFQIDMAEIQNLNEAFGDFDGFQPDGTKGTPSGTLAAPERNAMMSTWQRYTKMGQGQFVAFTEGGMTLQAVGTLQACDIKGDKSSLSPMHFAPHLPFIRAVQIDSSDTCDKLLKTILCFSGDDMLFQPKEMDALQATSVLVAGDLKLYKAELDLLVTKLGTDDAAGKDMVFNDEGTELKNFLDGIQATVKPIRSDKFLKAGGTVV